MRHKQSKRSFFTGRRSEMVTLLALQRLRRQGIIIDFRKRDGSGVDFYLDLPDPPPSEMPLQTKSSFTGQWEHERRYAGIPCVVVSSEARKACGTPRQEEFVKMIYEDIRACIETFRRSAES
jgi:hypothetical protein